MEGSPGVPSDPHPALRVLQVVLVCLAITGAASIATDLAGWWRLALFAPILLYIALRVALRAGWPALAGIAVGAVVMPVLALLGVDRVWAVVTEWRLPALLSALVGAVVLGLLVWVYLHRELVPVACRHPRIWAAAIAFGLVFLPPLGVAAWNAVTGDRKDLDQSAETVSQLDLIVLRDSSHVPNPGSRRRHGWEIRVWNGRVDGDRVRWGVQGAPPEVPSTGSDRVLLLLVDGGPDALRPPTWRSTLTS